MPILSGCCFCFDLKVGTKIIGVLNLIGAILSTISMSISLIMVSFMGAAVDTAALFEDIHNSNNMEDDYTDASLQPKSVLELVQEHINYVKIALYIVLAMVLIQIITSSMLIHGVKHDRRGLLVPFMGQSVVNILIGLILNITMLVIFNAHEMIIYTFIGALAGMSIQVYFVLVIVSQYQALGLIRMHEEISMK